jgi:hypothetical protein
MQHQPGRGFKTLAPFLNPAPPAQSIKYCDSPYHILATNVNTHLRAYAGNLRASVRNGLPLFPRFPTETPKRSKLFLEHLVGIMRASDLWHDQDEAAGDLSAPQLLERLAGFAQRPRAHLAANLSRRG